MIERRCLPLAVLLVACSPAPDLDAPQAQATDAAQELFALGAEGLRFHHDNGASGEYYFPEIMGAGVALLDADGDGDLDLFAVQGQRLDAGAEPAFALPADHRPGHRLFRNELAPRGTLAFTDVSERAGLAAQSYGMGVATGDYDNDGDVDLYVLNLGANTLFRNEGDGRFTDVTTQAGVAGDRWSVSASFFDYDRDGDLDLFVANYVRYSVATNLPCKGKAGQRDYCDPTVYAPARDRLYRNDGDGTFTDVTGAAGLDAVFGNGLGVSAADFNLDGWPDLYVANDKMANQLWINGGDGTFVDRALEFGAAYNASGAAEASMGIAAGDFDNDGDDDVFVTHLGAQTNTLYENDGKAAFFDITDLTRLAIPSLGFTGFGTEWFDVDNDARLDLFSANGGVQVETSQLGVEPYPYFQTDQLFRNAGDGKFEEVNAGKATSDAVISRGAAFGDIDNDGDVDIAVSSNNGPLRLLVNQVGTQRHWISLRLRGSADNAQALGARVAVWRESSDRPQWRRVHTDGSYASASDPRVHVGLGDDSGPVRVAVTWPNGAVEVWAGLAADQRHVLVQGAGAPVEPGR